MMIVDCRVMDSPIGELVLTAQEGRLCGVRLRNMGENVPQMPQDRVLEEAERQIREYFAGLRRTFDLPLQMNGSGFDCAVWTHLLEIPFAQIQSYGQIAGALGMPKAARAVGGACSRNPLLIVVPCHRVIAASGKLTGFAAGMQAKKTLLEHEGWSMDGDRLVLRNE